LGRLSSPFLPTGSVHASPVTGRDQNRIVTSQGCRQSAGRPWSLHCDEPADRTVRSSAPVASWSRRPRLPGMGYGPPAMARPRPQPRAGNHPLARHARANPAPGRGVDHDSQGAPTTSRSGRPLGRPLLETDPAGSLLAAHRSLVEATPRGVIFQAVQGVGVWHRRSWPSVPHQSGTRACDRRGPQSTNTAVPAHRPPDPEAPFPH
jgi:hypothetical protein